MAILQPKYVTHWANVGRSWRTRYRIQAPKTLRELRQVIHKKEQDYNSYS